MDRESKMEEQKTHTYEDLKRAALNLAYKMIIVDKSDPIYFYIRKDIFEDSECKSPGEMQLAFRKDTDMNFVVIIVNDDLNRPDFKVSMQKEE